MVVPGFSEIYAASGSPGLSSLASEYLDLLLAWDRRGALGRVLDAVDKGRSVKEIYLEVLQPVQYELGRLWQANRINVAQEHFCTAATQLVMSQLYPRLFLGPRSGKTLVATSVSGELHEVGIRMVADFFEMEGWDSWYLGSSMPARDILSSLEAHGADVLAVSVTMAYHLDEAIRLIDLVRDSEWGRQGRILVGGRQFALVPDLWLQLGADGFAQDAEAAIKVAEAFVGQAKPERPGPRAGTSPAGPASSALELVRERRDEIVELCAGRWASLMGGPAGQAGPLAAMLRKGAGFLTDTLIASLAMGRPELLDDPTTWAAQHLAYDGLPRPVLAANLEDYRLLLASLLPGPAREAIGPYLDRLLGMMEAPVEP